MNTNGNLAFATDNNTAPNEEYLELNFVAETATGKGTNTQFIMENLKDGTFRVTDGRVGIKVGRYKPKVYTRPMAEWHTTYENKVARGYLLTRTKKPEKKEITMGGMSCNGENFAAIENDSVRDIVERLLSFTNTVLNNNYTVKIEDVSDEMLAYGSNILTELATGFEKMSVAEFNNKLKILYQAIPRRIDKLSNVLAKFKSDFNDIIANEQELFDLMKNQANGVKATRTQTIIDANGLTWREVTKEEENKLIEMLGSERGRYVKAWRIENKRTESAFNNYCKKENLTDGMGIDHLFHGSRNENFWSIITNGLTINPVGVVITGKAYGNGTYFAPAAVKSMGYTSRSGSKWANGSSATGFLGVYKVATGKRYDGRLGCNHNLNYNELQKICPGAHCTWAEARYSGFMMDEVIVYQDQQSTIEYLVEVGL